MILIMGRFLQYILTHPGHAQGRKQTRRKFPEVLLVSR